MIRLMIIVIFVINSLFAISEDDNKYIYVETKQCFIPIPKFLEKGNVGKPFEYNYNYTNPKNMAMNSLRVFYDNEENYNSYIEKWLKYIPKQKLEKKQSLNGFTIAHIKDIEYSDINHILYYNDMIITMINFNENELNHLIDYCNKTKKGKRGQSPP